MYNIFIDKKFIASFTLLRDARAYIYHVMVSQLSRKGYDLFAVNFPRNGELHKYFFSNVGNYIVVFISKS